MADLTVKQKQIFDNYKKTHPKMSDVEILSALVILGQIQLSKEQKLSLFNNSTNNDSGIGLKLEHTGKSANPTNQPQETVFLQSGRKIVITKSQDGKDLYKYYAADGTQLNPDYFKQQEGVVRVSANRKTYTVTKNGKTVEKQAKNPLMAKIDQQQAELNKTKNEQGFIGKSWDWFKNKTDSFLPVDSSNEAQEQLDKERNLIKQIQNGKISKKDFKDVTGLDYSKENLQKFKSGELGLKSTEKIKGYQEGQEMACDVAGDLVSGIAAVGAYSLGVALAPVTGGTSLVVAVAIGGTLAIGTGAGVKAGLKYADAKSAGKEYTSGWHDAATGAFSGVLAPITGGTGGAIGKTVATKLGIQAVKSVGKEASTAVAESALRTALTNPTGYEYVGGTMAKRALAMSAEMATDGALGGAIDGGFRAGLDNDWDSSAILSGTVEGGVGGALMAPIIGGGFKAVGKGGHKLGEKIRGGKEASEAVEDIVAKEITESAEGVSPKAKVEETTNAKASEKQGKTLEGGVKDTELEEVAALQQIYTKNGIDKKINELRNKCKHVVTSIFKVNGNKEVSFEIFLGSKEASNDAYYVLNKDTGVLYYAKYPRMPELEILAANIYKLAGLKVPNIELFSSPDGKIGVLSEYIPNLEGIKTPNKSLYEGYAVDALLANHDVIGADHKNSMTDGTNVYRIDMGCSFDRRGKGLKKEYSAIVKEIVSLMHPDINIDGADIFTEMTREDLIKSLEKVCNIDEKALEKLFDTETKKQFLSIVKKRIVYLKEFLNQLKTTPQGNMPLIDYLQSMQKTLTPAENTKINLVDAQNNKVQTKRVIIQDETTINKNDINLRDNVLNMKDQNGKFKRLVHAMEHAEIGFARQEGDIIITKISENTYRIEREFKVIDITPEQIVENIKSMFILQEQFISHIELMYQAGEMSTELLNQIYDAVLKSKDCPLEYQKCINDFKRGGYIDINRLCNGDDMSYLESKKGLSTSGLVPKTIAGLKKDITILSQFLEYFKTNSPLSLYRVDSYSVIEKIIIQSGKFKGEKLVNVLKNSNGKLSIDDINNIINNISDFEQKSFLSTTIDKNLLIGENPIPIMSEEVAGASRDIIWNFTTKGEITGVFIEPFKTILSEENYEGEFLLQRNSKIHITDIKYNTTLGKWEISAQIYQ